MTIGIDLSSLQGAHRMRGIGYTLLNFINTMSATDRNEHHFVFYVYPNGIADDPLPLLNLKGMNYEVRELQPRQRSRRTLPGRLNLLISALNQLIELKDLHLGDSRLRNTRDLDFFLQTDQSQHLPKGHGFKKGLIIYDLIPYVLEWDYLWSYHTARRRGFSRKAALRVYTRRWLYAYKIRVNTRRADILLSISEETKKDFVKYLHTRPGKIVVTPLGVTPPGKEKVAEIMLQHYVHTSWGYLPRPLTLDEDTPFLLYVGGADRRRKLSDLVMAFNHLRAQGTAIKLVLVGDSMQGPANIATEETQYALKTSSYKEDIIYMGFADDQTRDWLYMNALAFIFPSRYEGFGLPVLEAMAHRCPVITYRNQATVEVAGDAPLYVNDALEIKTAIYTLLQENLTERTARIQKGLSQAEKYDWAKTSEAMVRAVGH